MTRLHDLTLVEQVGALRRREVRAVDLLAHYLDRIDRHGAALGAFVTLVPELARREAERADALLDAGGDDLPPLLGIPLAYKDLMPVAGVRTTFGSAAFADLVPPADGHVVGLLRAAGAVTVGTTHAPEFGPTCLSDSALVDRPAFTPYDLGRYASGSSGGAAAAVAAGLLPFAHGSDGAGSLRTPASVTGLVGVKASRGRVSPGAAAAFVSWSTEGPLARTVEDAALALDVMAQPRPGDLYAQPGKGGLLEATRRDPGRPLHVLAFTDTGLGDPDPACVSAVDHASGLLRDLGHEVVEGANPVPWTDDLTDAMGTVVSVSIAATVAAAVPPDRRQLLRPYTQWCVERGATTTAVQHAAAQARLARAAAAVLAASSAYDVVLTPTAAAPPVLVGEFEKDGPGEAMGRRMLAWSAYTPWANLCGTPSISLPLHVTPDGLPVGVLLTGSRVGDDARLLSLAASVERAAPFAHRHPPHWGE